MLFENGVPKTFQREVVNIVVYTLNKAQLKKCMEKKPYELWFGYSPSIKYFKIFGSKYYIKRDYVVGKFDPRSDEGMFLGYSLKSKAYKCFNYRTKTIVECANVRIDEKFGTKEKMMDYNSNEDNDYSTINNRNNDLFLKINNDLQNKVRIEEIREDQSIVPEIRVEVATPTINKNMMRNHLANQIIGSKEK